MTQWVPRMLFGPVGCFVENFRPEGYSWRRKLPNLFANWCGLLPRCHFHTQGTTCKGHHPKHQGEALPEPKAGLKCGGKAPPLASLALFLAGRDNWSVEIGANLSRPERLLP